MPHHARAARTFQHHHIAVAVSSLLLSGTALAQSAAPAPAAAASAPARPAAAAPATAATAGKGDERQVITVTGVRGSIEGAIDRKRRAATVTDQIVAEDINQFPDKTIGDAMSRITGVQLGRDGDSGEGSSVSIRGMDPSWTRVEINGMTQLGASINNSSNASDLREISAEMVKSIEVVKGTLPNLREGGIGGSVRVETRKPLDFKERFVQFSAAAQHATNIGTTTPRLAFIATDKFFNNRLGVMLNLTYDDVNVRGDAATSGGGGGSGTTANFNLQRDWNFADPNQAKTFVSANAQSAAVTNKAGCAALVSSNTAVITTANLIADCNRQYNDYAPTVPRLNIRERDVKRISADLTLQWKVTDQLSTWLTHQPNQQKFKFRNFDYGFTLVADDLGSSLGAMNDRFRSSVGGRAPVYNADGSLRTAGACGPAATASTNIPVTLNAANLVTAVTLGDCNFVRNLGGNNLLSSATREQDIDIRSEYNQIGWAYRGDLWRIDGFIGASRQGYVESNFNAGLGINVPGLQLQPTDKNISTIVLPSNFDWYNPDNYSSASLNYSASLQVRKEKTGQIDFSRSLDLGPFNRLMFGASYTDQNSLRYGAGNSQYGTNVNTQGTEVFTSLLFDSLNPNNVVPAATQAFRPSGTAPGTAPNLFVGRLNMERNITRPEMARYLQTVLQRTPGTFMADSSLAGSVPANWLAPSKQAALDSGMFNGINTTDLMNTGRLTRSPGSDGNTYAQQPVFDVTQRVTGAYTRVDWDLPVVAGFTLDGNLGARFTRTEVESAGFLSVPVPRAPGSTAPQTFTRSLVEVKHAYNDVLPSINFAATAPGGNFTTRLGWGKVLTRPNLDSLRPNIQCTPDDPLSPDSDGIENCTGGSPVLKPFRANKTDLSFEYYPRRGSQVSLAFYRVDIKVDSPGSARRDLGLVDLGDGVLRSVSVPENREPGPITSGVEFAVRTAFTYLPGIWRNFGADFNVTRNNAKYAPGTEQFINIAGSYNIVAPRIGMSRTTTNYSLWYDDGKLSGRVAVSSRDAFFRGIDRRNYPWYSIASTFIDAKVSYKFTPNLQVALEGKNLGRQESTFYMQRTDLPRDYTWNGRRFFLTGSYRF